MKSASGAKVASGLSLGVGVLLAGRYRLDGPIGQGGMGEVWRGVDLRLNRPIAIKVLPSDLASNADGVARFRREAETAAALQHPGITVVFDIDRHEDVLFLVMELLDGRDLRTVIRESPGGLPIARAVSLTVQVADALAAAHSRGVVHRDIKPANLLVLPDGRVKICDFGIARLTDATTQLTATGGTLGTPQYMAPEQFRGEVVDQRADLYALGCVLYEMLTGSLAFDADSVPALMYQHLSAPPKAPRAKRPEIPEQLDRLVLDLLAKEPAQRPPSAAAVAAFLNGLGSTTPQAVLPQTAPPAPPTLPDTRFPAPSGSGRSRKGLLAIAAGVVALLAVVGGVFLLNNKGNGHTAASRSSGVRTGGPSSPSSTAPTSSSSSNAPTGPVPSTFTPDGTTLKLGQTARLHVSENGGHIQVAVTVTGIAQAPAADLANVKSVQPLAGRTPYYLHFTVANVGPADPYLSTDFGLFLQGLLSDGNLPDDVGGTYPKQCSGGNVDYGAWTSNAVFHFCTVTLAPAPSDPSGVHATVVGAQWWDIESSDANHHAVYWKP